MKQKMQCLLMMLVAAAMYNGYAQLLPRNIKEISFYVRPVNSQGARDEIVYIDSAIKPSVKNPGLFFEYYIYLQTDCKTLKISSVIIDKVKYNFKVKRIQSPVEIEGTQVKSTLVKKSKFNVFAVTDLHETTELKDERAANHSLVIKGFVNSKPFTASRAAKQLDPLVAQ